MPMQNMSPMTTAYPPQYSKYLYNYKIMKSIFTKVVTLVTKVKVFSCWPLAGAQF